MQIRYIWICQFLDTINLQTKTHICLITDYCPGGELFLLLDRQPAKVLKEDAARYINILYYFMHIYHKYRVPATETASLKTSMWIIINSATQYMFIFLPSCLSLLIINYIQIILDLPLLSYLPLTLLQQGYFVSLFTCLHTDRDHLSHLVYYTLSPSIKCCQFYVILKNRICGNIWLVGIGYGTPKWDKWSLSPTHHFSYIPCFSSVDIIYSYKHLFLNAFPLLHFYTHNRHNRCSF